MMYQGGTGFVMENGFQMVLIKYNSFTSYLPLNIYIYIPEYMMWER